MIMEKFGHEQKKSKSHGFKLMYTYSDKIGGYSYSVKNEKDRPQFVTIDCKDSKDMLFSTPTQVVTKLINSGETEFFLYTMSMPNHKGKRDIKVETKPLNYNADQ